MTAIERDVLHWTRIVLRNAERANNGLPVAPDQVQERVDAEAVLFSRGLQLMRDHGRKAGAR